MIIREAGIFLIIALVAGAASIGYLSHKTFKLSEDNLIEEVAEEIIEDQLGLDVDLSPDSPEK